MIFKKRTFEILSLLNIKKRLKKKNPDNFVTIKEYKDDREKIKKWFTTSLIKRTFSGTPDNVLRPIRNILRINSDKFPLDKIINHFKPTNKSLIFTDDEIEGLISYKYGQKHTFTILSTIYPWIDYRNRFHQDHIFPKSLFKASSLKKRGLSDKQIESFMGNYDFIGNLQLLPGHFNESKGSKEFENWLNEEFPDKIKRNYFIDRHYIPDGISLDFENFEEFLTKRNEILLEKFKKILQFDM